MNKIAIICVSLILVMLLGGCGTVNPPAPTPTPMPPVTPKATPSPMSTLTAPILLSPHNGATGVEHIPTFLWKEVPNARGYELTIAHNYDFADVYYDVSTTLTGYKFTEGVEPSSQYYWMVCAKLNPADPNTPIACSPVWTFTTASPSPTPKPTPAYHTLSFVLQGKDDYSFPIYLRNNESLHLMWRVQNSKDKVWFHILTPSGQGLGFYEDDGNYANGTLCDHATRGMLAGMTQFSPSDYDWGEGYYTMMANKYSQEPVTVKVEYWIEG